MHEENYVIRSYRQYPESFKQRWSPRGRPWQRGRPRGHILKSIALASSPRKLACPRLEDSTIF